MRDFLSIGPAPAEEECVQVGEPDYEARAQAECEQFIKLVRGKLGKEPEGARLRVKAFPHELGTYYEVVCYFDTDDPAARDYAFECEAGAPGRWRKEKDG